MSIYAAVIYELHFNSRRRFSFIPHDLRYFWDHFVCEPMGPDWEIPPVEVMGKSYKPADFVCWMLCAPIVSPRAKTALEDLSTGLVEFLPFHPINGVQYFAMNVLSRDNRQPIHKANAESAVFVNDLFGNVVRDQKLSGVALADPADEIGRKIVRGQDINVFPGLVD